MAFYIQNTTTGLVLDIKDSDCNSEARIVMWQYHGNPNQLWEERNGCIYSALNGLVLDVSGEDDQTIITYEAHGGENQKWSFIYDDTVQCGTGHVLDIRDGSQNEGADVIAGVRNGNWSQKFRRVYYPIVD